MGFEGFPFIIAWELTQSCNLQCRHCWSSASLPRTGELTLEESLAICDQFPALLVQEVHLTGGEPLLRPDWQKIAHYLSTLGIAAKIFTNGLALTPDKVAQIKDAGIAAVGVSIDGLEPTHDHIRGYPDLFRYVLAGIERVQNADIPLIVITTANALNLPELDALRELLRSLGIRTWQIQPILPLGRSHKSTELHLSEHEYQELGTFVQYWMQKTDRAGMEIQPGDSYGYFTEYDLREPPWQGCPAGLFSCGITSNGQVKGCLSLPDQLIEGDLAKRALWDVWFDPNSFAFTRQFSMAKMGIACHSCERADQCRGGCSAMSFGSTGSFHNDPYCFYGINLRRNNSLLNLRHQQKELITASN